MLRSSPGYTVAPSVMALSFTWARFACNTTPSGASAAGSGAWQASIAKSSVHPVLFQGVRLKGRPRRSNWSKRIGSGHGGRTTTPDAAAVSKSVLPFTHQVGRDGRALLSRWGERRQIWLDQMTDQRRLPNVWQQTIADLVAIVGIARQIPREKFLLVQQPQYDHNRNWNDREQSPEGT